MKKKNKKLVPIVVVVVIIGVLIWYFTRDKSDEIIDGNGNGNGNGGNGGGNGGNGGNGNGGSKRELITNAVATNKAKALVDDIWGFTYTIKKSLWNELMDYDDDNFAKIVHQADKYIYTMYNPWFGKQPSDFYELVDWETSPRLNSGNITNRINRLGI